MTFPPAWMHLTILSGADVLKSEYRSYVEAPTAYSGRGARHALATWRPDWIHLERRVGIRRLPFRIGTPRGVVSPRLRKPQIHSGWHGIGQL